MFIENKYHYWYFQIIEKAKTRTKISGYTEDHHIIPRVFGGPDNQDNLVVLTFREHFIVHWLLTKFTEGSDRRKMFSALILMCCRGKNGRDITSWQYEMRKRAGYQAFIGRRHSEETKRRLSEINKGNAFNAGKKHTVEARAKIAKARTGFKESEKRREEKRQFMLGNKNLLGHKHSKQTRAKMTESHMARPYKDRAVWRNKKLSEGHKSNISEGNYRRHAFRRALDESVTRFLSSERSKSRKIPSVTAPDSVE